MNNEIENVYPSPTATYDEVAQSSQLFWEKLKHFHSSFRTKFMIPTVGGKGLDLHRLFIEVTSRGGFEKVIGDRKWKEVVVVFNFPTTITSASFVLRKYYLSLLYHFEQLYYFRKQVPSLPANDSAYKTHLNHLGDDSDDGAVTNHLPGQLTLEFKAGYSVNGTIDGKFENGYLITVEMGSEQLRGVLYHVPHSSEVTSRRNRKKSRLALRDPSKPKSNRNNNPSYYAQDKAISKKMGLLWNEQQKQEKGVRDNKETLEYKTSYNNAELQ